MLRYLFRPRALFCLADGIVRVFRAAITMVLLTLIASTVLATENTTRPQVVTIGVVADNKPYTFFEGRTPSGFSIDVLKEVGRNSHITFDFRAGSWPDIYAAFLRGDLDAIDGISWRPDRAENILFTEPYHVREVYLMHDTAKTTPEIKSLEDLVGLRVGVVTDIFYSSRFQDAGITLNTYDSLPSLVRALAFGWIDVAVGPALTLEYLANQAGFRFLALLGPAPLDSLSSEDFRIGVHIDNPALFSRIRDGLNEIPEAHLNDLLERWQEYGGITAESVREVPLSSAQAQYLANLGPVRVGFMNDYAPFSFNESGRVLGMSVDIMTRLADLTRLQVIPVRGQWNELITMLQNGDIDVMADMSHRPEREPFARFTEPYHIIPNVIFTRHDNLNYESLSDLKDYRVAIGSGIYYEDAVRQTLPGNNVISFSSQESMFTAFAQDDVDAVIGSLHTGNYWIRNLGISGVRVAGELNVPGFTGEDLRFGVRPAMAPLADILNQGMSSITPTEQQIIENRWLGATVQRSSAPELSLQWNDSEAAWLNQHSNTIKICADPDWMPLEGIRNGQHAGFAADLLALLSSRADLNFELVETRSWADAVAAAKARHCDMYPMAMQTPERLTYMDFTTPYLEVPNVVIGRIEQPFIERINDLGSEPVGVVAGYAFSELLRVRNPALNLVTVDSEQDGLRRLQNGELAGYITTLATASYYMQSLGLADLKVIGRVPADWSLSVATRSDQPALHSIMQKLITSLTPEEREQFTSSWRDIKIEERIDYTLLWQIVAAGLIATLILVYWNRKLGRLNRELADANAALSHLSVTDSLTQLGNRAYFDRELASRFQWCQRHKVGFAVAMVDADHFKKINDTWGHESGDQCLQALAGVMREHFRRETDRLARFGGEEFVIFASYQDAPDIIKRLDHFRSAVARQRCTTCQNLDIDLTVSVGLALGIPSSDTTAAEYLRQADQALYAAKQNGRNCLEVKYCGQDVDH